MDDWGVGVLKSCKNCVTKNVIYITGADIDKPY